MAGRLPKTLDLILFFSVLLSAKMEGSGYP
jgi:hypothetical protein